MLQSVERPSLHLDVSRSVRCSYDMSSGIVRRIAFENEFLSDRNLFRQVFRL